MITGGLTLPIVAGVALGALVNGVAAAGGALAARHTRLVAAPAACRSLKG
jgi:hypothetical protein